MNDWNVEQKQKKMPYRVPEGFFGNFPDRMMQRVAWERTRRRVRRLWATAGATAAVVAGLVMAGLGFQNHDAGTEGWTELASTSTATAMDTYVSTLSDEELEAQLQLFELDATLLLDDYE